MEFEIGDRVQLRYDPEKFGYTSMGLQVTSSILLNEFNTLFHGTVIDGKTQSTAFPCVIIKFDVFPEESAECAIKFLEYSTQKEQPKEESVRDWFIRMMS